MTIESYDDLCPIAKIAYVQYCKGNFSQTKVEQLVTLGKITREEADWIYANCPT